MRLATFRTTPTIALRRVVAAAAAAAAAVAMAPSGTAHAADHAKAQATRRVDYLGHRFTVPASWPVIDLAAHPHTCVRFDRHAVYLGTPGPDQNCPGHVTGRTDALLVQPSSAPAAADGTTDRAVDQEFDATATRIKVTAIYGPAHRQAARAILASARIPANTPRSTAPAKARPVIAAAADPAALPPSATSYTGKGFDTCAAPSQATMTAWKSASPYAAVGVPVAGADHGITVNALHLTGVGGIDVVLGSTTSAAYNCG